MPTLYGTSRHGFQVCRWSDQGAVSRMDDDPRYAVKLSSWSSTLLHAIATSPEVVADHSLAAQSRGHLLAGNSCARFPAHAAKADHTAVELRRARNRGRIRLTIFRDWSMQSTTSRRPGTQTRYRRVLYVVAQSRARRAREHDRGRANRRSGRVMISRLVRKSRFCSAASDYEVESIK